MQTSIIPTETREKIIEVANTLFEQGGKMPTVDQVRRVAKVDMNAASLVMKEWRRAQLTASSPVVVAIPESIQQSLNVAAATIWSAAQELSNESLRNAQTMWDIERAELESMRSELAQAFQEQETEAAQLSATIAAQSEEIAKLNSELTENRILIERITAKANDRESESERFRLEAEEAKQKAARLEGSFEAIKQQNAELIAAIKPKK